MEDLITYFPRGYEDRSQPKAIADLADGEEALVEAVAVTKMSTARIRNNMTICKLVIRDETATCQVTWFNQAYLKDRFHIGEKYKFYGKVKRKLGQIDLISPTFDEENMSRNTGKIIPLYPLTYELSQNVIRRIIENGLKEVGSGLEETLPEYILKEYKLLDINNAINSIHFPKDFKEYDIARRRLVFEELLTMQLALLNLKNKYSTDTKGIAFDKDVKISSVIDKLPFKLTKAQIRCLEEIEKDMEKDKPMNRLLQGDVGSGKTIVSMLSAYKAVRSGYQAAIMVPTAILAAQHYENFEKILNGIEEDGGKIPLVTCGDIPPLARGENHVKIALLTSATTKKKKEEILQRLQNGEIDILIGTHAILEENVVFNNLGLVVTDEQHRFGVRQRSKINKKGENPDVLVMTATPIPRTLALILYGDLDISIIDELPPNRKSIDTFAVTKGMDERVNNFVKEQIKEGRQAYIVCPLVGQEDVGVGVPDDPQINAKSVLELAEAYKNEVFKDYKVEYIHGRLRPKEKDSVMQEFKNGNIDILIATTVIEVGVDVPNASIMIIENAERFGLATLHQLRGRVGRGEHKSYCILKYHGSSELTRERMKVMAKTNDGFVISEKDLELRGSGEFFGTKQHGLPEFKIANLFEDIEMLKGVQAVAVKIIEEDPNLEQEKNAKLREIVEGKFKQGIEM